MYDFPVGTAGKTIKTFTVGLSHPPQYFLFLMLIFCANLTNSEKKRKNLRRLKKHLLSYDYSSSISFEINSKLINGGQKLVKDSTMCHIYLTWLRFCTSGYNECFLLYQDIF